MLIAHVNTEPGWGGGEAQTLHLVRGLRESGHECVLYLSRRGRLQQLARAAGFEIRFLPGRHLINPAPYLFLRREITAGDFDICHLHTAHAVAIGVCATAGNDRPRRIATRRMSHPLGRNWFGWTRHWSGLDHVIAVSEEVRRSVVDAGIHPRRISVVHSAVDLSRFEAPCDGNRFRAEVGWENGEYLVGSVSRLTPRKGHDLLIEAAERLLHCHPNARFVVVGDGESERRLARRIRALGLQDRIILTGFREDIPDILAGLDCLVFPAASGEGSPGILKEAMAAGVPIVAVDHPVIREIVTPGRSALLFPANRIDAIVAAVGRVIRFPDSARALAACARREARRFSIDRMVASTEAIYRKVLDDRRSRRAV